MGPYQRSINLRYFTSYLLAISFIKFLTCFFFQFSGIIDQHFIVPLSKLQLIGQITAYAEFAAKLVLNALSTGALPLTSPLPMRVRTGT
jgi:hypothetical protein